MGSVSGLGRSPGEGKGSSFQYYCLGNPLDGGAWQPTVHGVARVRHDLATKPPTPWLKEPVIRGFPRALKLPGQARIPET